jgi:hypothetical protein
MTLKHIDFPNIKKIMVFMKKILLLIMTANAMILFSQENNYQFINYRLGTELSQILENEGTPDMIDERLNEYCYFSKTYEYFGLNYSYTFLIDYSYRFLENK